MAFSTTTNTYPTVDTKDNWWQRIASALDPIFSMMRQPSSRTETSDLLYVMNTVHTANSQAHTAALPPHIQGQLIAALTNLQTSFAARQAGEQRQSAKYWRMAQVEWVLFEEMLSREGIRYHY